MCHINYIKYCARVFSKALVTRNSKKYSYSLRKYHMGWSTHTRTYQSTYTHYSSTLVGYLSQPRPVGCAVSKTCCAVCDVGHSQQLPESTRICWLCWHGRSMVILVTVVTITDAYVDSVWPVWSLTYQNHIYICYWWLSITDNQHHLI